MSWRLSKAGCCAAVVAIAGCTAGDGPATYPVSGVVTYQGRPIDEGRVVFVPDRGAANPGPVHAAKISRGRFAGEASAGKKIVEVYASLNTGKYDTREDGTKFEVQTGLPVRHNASSQLEVTIEPRSNEGMEFHLE